MFGSTLTFIGSVTPVTFLGGIPVFIDCDRETWNMDPVLLEAELERCAKAGKLPKAVAPTDLYGQCCDYARIYAVCQRYGVPVVIRPVWKPMHLQPVFDCGGQISEVRKESRDIQRG